MLLAENDRIRKENIQLQKENERLRTSHPKSKTSRLRHEFGMHKTAANANADGKGASPAHSPLAVVCARLRASAISHGPTVRFAVTIPSSPVAADPPSSLDLSSPDTAGGSDEDKKTITIDDDEADGPNNAVQEQAKFKSESESESDDDNEDQGPENGGGAIQAERQLVKALPKPLLAPPAARSPSPPPEPAPVEQWSAEPQVPAEEISIPDAVLAISDADLAPLDIPEDMEGVDQQPQPAAAQGPRDEEMEEGPVLERPITPDQTILHDVDIYDASPARAIVVDEDVEMTVLPEPVQVAGPQFELQEAVDKEVEMDFGPDRPCVSAETSQLPGTAPNLIPVFAHAAPVDRTTPPPRAPSPAPASAPALAPAPVPAPTPGPPPPGPRAIRRPIRSGNPLLAPNRRKPQALGRRLKDVPCAVLGRDGRAIKSPTSSPAPSVPSTPKMAAAGARVLPSPSQALRPALFPISAPPSTPIPAPHYLEPAIPAVKRTNSASYDTPSPPDVVRFQGRRVAPLPSRALLGRSAADEDARRKDAAAAKRAWKEKEAQETYARNATRLTEEAPRTKMPPVGSNNEEVPSINDQLLVVGSDEVDRQLRHILHPLWDILDRTAFNRFGQLALSQLAIRRWNMNMEDEQPEGTYLTRVAFESHVNVWMDEFLVDLVNQRVVLDNPEEISEVIEQWKAEVDRQGRL